MPRRPLFLRTRLAVVVGVLLVAAACSSSSATRAANPILRPSAGSSRGRTVAQPLVSGPVTGGHPDVPANAMPAGLAQRYGYDEREYFVSGRATAYQPVGTWGADGQWTAAPSTTAAYKTRIIVRTPKDPTKFNGTVVVEWLNVTSGRDTDPDFGFAYPLLMSQGYAYVGVTAQKVGVTGGAALPIPGYHPKGLVDQNPTRYASLSHPGDDYSYDIFSQAAQAVRRPKGLNPLGSLHPKRIIADGESQSASRMATYVNAVAPITKMFDAYLIHSRGSGGASVDGKPTDVPKTFFLRSDRTDPVMQIETETDLFGLGFYPARQDDDAHLRTWELAGTSHVDQTTLDYGIASGHVWSPGEVAPDFLALCGRVNDGPESYLMRAAFASLNTWITTGHPPATGQRFAVAAGSIARDGRGNAIGGVRTPAVDVPISTLTGVADANASIICSLFGGSKPFDAATLTALYPTHRDYLQKVTASAAAAVKAGFLLPADQKLIVAQAATAPVPD